MPKPKRFTEIGQSECDISTFSVRLILQPQQLARFPAERGGAYFRILDREETEFYQNPCIVPPYRHILILEMVMSISGYNSFDDEGSIIGLRSVAEPLRSLAVARRQPHFAVTALSTPTRGNAKARSRT